MFRNGFPIYMWKKLRSARDFKTSLRSQLKMRYMFLWRKFSTTTFKNFCSQTASHMHLEEASHTLVISHFITSLRSQWTQAIVSHIFTSCRVRNTSDCVAHTDTLQVSDESVAFSSRSCAFTAIFTKSKFSQIQGKRALSLHHGISSF